MFAPAFSRRRRRFSYRAARPDCRDNATIRAISTIRWARTGNLARDNAFPEAVVAQGRRSAPKTCTQHAQVLV